MLNRPNILLITSDQQHYDTIGAFNSQIKTPNIDKLVLRGTSFKRAYCANPTCTPSRASIPQLKLNSFNKLNIMMPR